MTRIDDRGSDPAAATTAGGRAPIAPGVVAAGRRTLVAVAAALAGWALVVVITGGIVFQAGSVRVSSRAADRPAWFALVALALAWILAPRGRRTRTIAGDATRALGRAAPERVAGAVHPTMAANVRRLTGWVPLAIGVAAALTTIVIGFREGVFVAGGADSYGYISEAHLLATGALEMTEPMIERFRDTVPPETWAPLGYAVSHGSTMVPTYSAGFPLVMAAFERAAGVGAVYYVLPLLAGVAVLCTYVIGREIGGSLAGAAAAVLVASSPAFLFMLTAAPMSDIPVSTWWAVALALIVGSASPVSALAAGFAAGLAIVTRPNLVPLAAIPGLMLLASAVRSRAPRDVWRVLLFAPGVLAGCAVVALFNARWYGSPLTSGYGPLDQYYAWGYFPANVSHYAMWLGQTSTPLIALALLAPFVLRRQRDVEGRQGGVVIGMGLFAAGVIASYLFYLPFDDWWFLRFLLPAYPPLMALVAATLLAMARRRVPEFATLIVTIVIVLVAAYGIRFSRERGVFASELELKYQAAGEYVRDRLPASTVVLAMQHSGSIRHYSGRPTLRYDKIEPARFDAVVAALTARGYQVYLVIDDWEEAAFRKQFNGHSRQGALDTPPITRVSDGRVGVWDVVPGK